MSFDKNFYNKSKIENLLKKTRELVKEEEIKYGVLAIKIKLI